jgi:hypothetical protein
MRSGDGRTVLSGEYGQYRTIHTFVQDLCTLRSVSLDVLAELAAGYQVNDSEHPFYVQATRHTFARLFGKADAPTYYRAYKQSVAYNSFTDTLRTLARRWATAASSHTLGKRGVRFVEDTEWQPDDRVVVFQTFYTGTICPVMLRVPAYKTRQSHMGDDGLRSAHLTVSQTRRRAHDIWRSICAGQAGRRPQVVQLLWHD